MGPVAPAGAAIPPASHTQNLMWPPVPLGYPPYSPRLNMSSAQLERFDIIQVPYFTSPVTRTSHRHPRYPDDPSIDGSS